MKIWHKLLIAGTATVTLCAVAGYRYYSHIKQKQEDARLKTEKAKLEYEKHITLQIMDNALVQCMESFEELAAIMRLVKEQNTQEIQDLVKNKVNYMLQQAEERACKEVGKSVEEYYSSLARLEEKSDPDIIQKFNTFEDISKSILSAQEPKISFTFSENLTPELTLKLFKLIWMSQLFIDNKNLAYCSQADVKDTIAHCEEQGCRARERIMSRYGLAQKSVLQEAYWHYNTRDEDFCKKMQKVIMIKKVMETEIYAKKDIPELSENPILLQDDEFEEWYSKIEQKYGEKEWDEGFSVIDESKAYKLEEHKESQQSFFSGFSSFMTNLGKSLKELQEKAQKEKTESITKPQQNSLS